MNMQEQPVAKLCVFDNTEQDTSLFCPTNHEEGETRLFLPVKDMADKDIRGVMIRTVDTDVLALAISLFNDFGVTQLLDRLWVCQTSYFFAYT